MKNINAEKVDKLLVPMNACSMGSGDHCGTVDYGHCDFWSQDYCAPNGQDLGSCSWWSTDRT